MQVSFGPQAFGERTYEHRRSSYLVSITAVTPGAVGPKIFPPYLNHAVRCIIEAFFFAEPLD